MKVGVGEFTAPAVVLRTVRLTTSPPGASVEFVPISPADGEPMADRAIKAQSRSPVQVILSPGDYRVEAVLPDGRFHDVLRHVPKQGEQGLRSENHLRWTPQDDGSIEVPKIDIPDSSVTDRMLLVYTTNDLEIGPSRSETRAHNCDSILLYRRRRNASQRIY